LFAALPELSGCGLRLPPFDETPGDAADAVDVPEESFPSLFGSGLQALETVDAPVAQEHGNENLFVVSCEVVDARVRYRAGVPCEIRDAGAGHGEVAYLSVDRGHDCRRVDRERGGRQVSVEEVMKVLV